MQVNDRQADWVQRRVFGCRVMLSTQRRNLTIVQLEYLYDAVGRFHSGPSSASPSNDTRTRLVPASLPLMPPPPPSSPPSHLGQPRTHGPGEHSANFSSPAFQPTNYWNTWSTFSRKSSNTPGTRGVRPSLDDPRGMHCRVHRPRR